MGDFLLAPDVPFLWKMRCGCIPMSNSDLLPSSKMLRYAFSQILIRTVLRTAEKQLHSLLTAIIMKKCKNFCMFSVGLAKLFFYMDGI